MMQPKNPITCNDSKIKILGLIIAIGVVYGDIGTSPLYVMKAIVRGLPTMTSDYIIGAVSCILWTLTLQTTVKYIMITLKADNKGEGGILSLFALIRRKYRWTYVLAIIGAAALLADGIITPSITVTTAIEGLNTLYSGIPVVPVVAVIIFLLFMFQPFGTASLGKCFGSIMVFWFLMLGILGFVNLLHYPGIIKALNPYYAIRFIIVAPNTLVILGAVFLCTTGAEALYSDLGHCGLKNIKITWVFVKTTLILNYLGQGAWIITHASAMHSELNPFFAIMPQWFSTAGVIMATMAAIIASQALISGSFSVINEAVALKLWPNIKIKYPTERRGQMFIPSINYILMFLCLIVIFTFKSSDNMEGAYGLSISLAMLMTTSLLFFYFRVKKMALWKAIPLTLCFLTIETGFLIANSTKFMHGGYITILIAGVLFAIMWIWYNGQIVRGNYVSFKKIAPVIPILENMSNDKEIPKFATHLIYITRTKYENEIESKIIYSLLHKHPKRADTYWFVYIECGDEPYEFSYKVKTYIPGKIFGVSITSGFKVGMHIDSFLYKITTDLEKEGKVDLTSRYPSLKETGIRGDYRFVIVDRILTTTGHKMKFFTKALMYLYLFIKKFTTPATQLLDIDPSSVTHETVPLFGINKEK